MNSDKTYIAVMDQRDGTIKMYIVPNKELNTDFDERQYENDTEEWLYNNTDFDSDCSYMASNKPIKVIQK